jgi:hypothetical protein
MIRRNECQHQQLTLMGSPHLDKQSCMCARAYLRRAGVQNVACCRVGKMQLFLASLAQLLHARVALGFLLLANGKSLEMSSGIDLTLLYCYEFHVSWREVEGFIRCNGLPKFTSNYSRHLLLSYSYNKVQ